MHATADTAMEIIAGQVPLDVLLDSVEGDPRKAVRAIESVLKQSGIEMTKGELNLLGIVAAEASAYQQDASFSREIALERLKDVPYGQAQTAASQTLWQEATDRVITHGIADFAFGLDEDSGQGNQLAAWDEQIPQQGADGVDRLVDGEYNDSGKSHQSEAISATENGSNEGSSGEIAVAGVAEPKKKGKNELEVSATDEYNSCSTKDWTESVGSSSWGQAAQEEMLLAEYKTIGERVETARLYDANGSLILKKAGDEWHVVFTNKEVKRMNGCVLTHNHPNNSCFSPPDINMLRRGKLAEIRAVTANGIYCLQNPTGKWKRSISNLEKIENAYWCIDKEVSMEFYNRARMGKITYAQAEQLGQESTLCEFARRYGLSFKFDSWETVRRKK